MVRLLGLAGLMLIAAFHATIAFAITAVRFGLALLDWIVSAMVILFLLATPAWAQAITAAPTAIHLNSDLQSQLVNIAAALIVAIGMAIWKWLDAHSPLKNAQAEDLARQAYMALLQKGAEFGATQLDATLTHVGTVYVGNAAVAAGANFVMAHGAEIAAKAAGVDITTPEGQAKIVQSVASRVGTLLGNASAANAPIYKIALPVAVLPAPALKTA